MRTPPLRPFAVPLKETALALSKHLFSETKPWSFPRQSPVGTIDFGGVVQSDKPELRKEHVMSRGLFLAGLVLIATVGCSGPGPCAVPGPAARDVQFKMHTLNAES